MSFRIEDKISLNKYNSALFLKFLSNKGLKKLYDNRNINSVYFDNTNLSMFYESEEGTRPRHKIRIRNYNDLEDYVLEKKISSDEGRFKTTRKINKLKYNYFLKKGILSNIYGKCSPLVVVNYTRSYYQLKNTRITYDFNIKYIKFSRFKNVFKDERRVFEIKSHKLFLYF